MCREFAPRLLSHILIAPTATTEPQNLPPPLSAGPEPRPKLRGDSRTFRVWLDPNQYQQDMTNSIQSGAEDPYETFNIIMRRKPKENNFKVRVPAAPEGPSRRPGALSPDLELRPGRVMYHAYDTLLGYCSCEVGAGAARDCQPLKAF